MKKIGIFSYILLIVVVLSAGYFLSKDLKKNSPVQVACTQDAKICEDGTTVKRVGPNCEFESCPLVVKQEETKPISASSTKTIFDVSQKISYEYTDNFYLENNLTEYVVPVQWPPEVSVSAEKYSCKTGSQTKIVNINGKNYCVTTQAEGAAGSIYTTYTYKALLNKKVVSINFIVRAPQCANYDDPKKTACEEEKKNFDINAMVAKIFESIKFQ